MTNNKKPHLGSGSKRGLKMLAQHVKTYGHKEFGFDLKNDKSCKEWKDILRACDWINKTTGDVAERDPKTLDSECIKWGQDILRKKGHDAWTIKWSHGSSSEGVAIFKTKLIYIRWPSGCPNYSLMLHEIAHVVTGPRGHDSEFAHQYMYLVRRFLEQQRLPPS